ncbi:hypothetical protein [Streptomyces sp. NPDC056669]|uniref:hypothetical protein n=1 Tax=unclassified Streptomyces TaxID=2593676 RepID=UPI00369B59C4
MPVTGPASGLQEQSAQVERHVGFGQGLPLGRVADAEVVGPEDHFASELLDPAQPLALVGVDAAHDGVVRARVAAGLTGQVHHDDAPTVGVGLLVRPAERVEGGRHLAEVEERERAHELHAQQGRFVRGPQPACEFQAHSDQSRCVRGQRQTFASHEPVAGLGQPEQVDEEADAALVVHGLGVGAQVFQRDEDPLRIGFVADEAAHPERVQIGGEGRVVPRELPEPLVGDPVVARDGRDVGEARVVLGLLLRAELTDVDEQQP